MNEKSRQLRQPLWTVSRDRGVVTCVYSNPPDHTLTYRGICEIGDIVNGLHGDPEVKVVVFTGAGDGVFIKHYNVGDLLKQAEYQKQHPPLRSDTDELNDFHRLGISLAELDAITVAAVNGSTAGAGLEFALMSDFRLMADGNFQIGLPETAVGVLPGGGGLTRMQRLLGLARALDLILHAELVSPARALELGLVHRIADANEFVDFVRAFARDLAKRSPIALVAAKRALYRGADVSLEAALRIEEAQLDVTMNSVDAVEALRRYQQTDQLDGTDFPWRGK